MRPLHAFPEGDIMTCTDQKCLHLTCFECIEIWKLVSECDYHEHLSFSSKALLLHELWKGLLQVFWWISFFPTPLQAQHRTIMTEH